MTWVVRATAGLASIIFIFVGLLFIVWTRPDEPEEPQTDFAVARRHTQSGDFQAGATVLIYEANPTEFASKTSRVLDRLVEDNVNAISLTFPVYQATWHSTEVSRYAATLTDSNIEFFVKRAHDRGFVVLLRPIIDEQAFFDDPRDCGGSGQPICRWRGNIEPSDVAAWFGSYQRLMVSYARVAQASGVELFSIGVELNSMAQEKNLPYWNALISAVRDVYSGDLIYSMNHGVAETMGFEEQLDYIGIDAFYALSAPSNPTVEQLIQEWQRITPFFEQTARRFNKPVILTELGVRAEEGAFLHPWFWEQHTPLDIEQQRVYYEAACRATRPAVSGLYFWHTTLYPPDRPEQDPSFEFAGKPAEQELAACYAG